MRRMSLTDRLTEKTSARLTRPEIEFAELQKLEPLIPQRLRKLLADHCNPPGIDEQERRLTLGEQASIAPAVPALATAVFFYMFNTRLAELGMKLGATQPKRRATGRGRDAQSQVRRSRRQGGWGLERRRVRLKTLRNQAMKCLDAIDAISPYDQLALSDADGVDFAGLEKALRILRDRCKERAASPTRVGMTPLRFRAELIERVGGIVRELGIPCSQNRNGLAAAILVRVFVVAGIPVPRHMEDDLVALKSGAAEPTGGWESY